MHPRNTPLTIEEKEEIRRVYLKVNNQKIVAEMLGHSTTTVWKTLKGYGLNKGQGGNQEKSKKISDSELLEAVKTMTTQEIAKSYSIHETNVLRRCKRLGVKPVDSAKQLSGISKHWGKHNENLSNPSIGLGNVWHYIASHDAIIKDTHPHMIYLESRGKRVRIRCRECGRVIEREYSTIKRCSIECEYCSERHKTENELLQERIKLMRFFIALKESQEPKICACCGEQFFSQYAVALYCSDKCKKKAKRLRYKERNPEKAAECRRKYTQDKHYIQRARKYGCAYEYGITRAKVAKRDNNVCQICGKVCNPLDKTWGDFGPDYPTLDHIIPLSKGGPHLWGNVQCACGECNSSKRDIYTVKMKRRLVT